MLSIIVPIYNSLKYIHRCLDSLILQTYSNIEIILINDGSTDGCVDVCHKYVLRDNRINVFSQPNSGVSSARNYGLSLAKGKYIMFLDSDDYMFPEMCETMVNAIETIGADCVICGTTETWGKLWAPAKDVNYDTLSQFKKDFVQQLSTELLSPPWNKIYKRELITEIFDTSVSFGEDLMFNLNYFTNCNKISFISAAPFYHEKANENSLVNKVYLSRLSEIETVHSAVLAFYEGSDPRINKKYIRDILVYYRAIVQNLNYTKKERYSYFNEWIKSSHLSNMKLMGLKIGWTNHLLLFFVRNRIWKLAEMQINWRSIYKYLFK